MKTDDPSTIRMAMIVVSIISAVASMSIVAAYLLLPTLRSRKYYEVLFYAAVSNFMTSIGSSLGIPRDQSAACWFQGLTTNIFTLASIFWTVIIAFMLKEVIDSATIFDIKPWIHGLCWGVPIVVSLLPLSQMRYGSTGKEWCFIDRLHDDDPKWKVTLWAWLSFYIWVFISIGVILLVYLKVLQKKFVRMTEKVLVEKMFNKLKYYPLVIIVCWLPSSIYDTRPDYLRVINLISTILCCLHGFLFACVFWYMNSEALKRSNGGGETTNSKRANNSTPLFEMYLSSDTSGNSSTMTKDTPLTLASSYRESSFCSSGNPLRAMSSVEEDPGIDVA
jgi:hypothetical protein